MAHRFVLILAVGLAGCAGGRRAKAPNESVDGTGTVCQQIRQATRSPSGSAYKDAVRHATGCSLTFSGARTAAFQHHAAWVRELAALGFSEDLSVAADGPEGSHAGYTEGSRTCELDLTYMDADPDGATMLRLRCAG